ncbi:MAG: hypothetical protein JWM70_216 [Microbacteriaceae bacterium]|nr:hypothetical protein [Microbacteriaceae bacterium]
MSNRLASAVSPYLRSHADNPVDWQQWGAEPFEEAARRGVPVLVSIGYSTCHWCHVMARESFSDPVLAGYLNENFVSIKVDREEYPDVDSSYLAAAGVFTENLGWPLNVFVTPEGKAFFAGTYWPPQPIPGHPSVRQVLESVVDAWTGRRDQVEHDASQVAVALAALADAGGQVGSELPDAEALSRVVGELVDYEDDRFGGFGGAPKFPVAPVVLFLLDRGAAGDADAAALAERTLVSIAGSDLRDAVDGGFFRYATRRDWSEPHYERMLYDNALLLSAYTRLAQLGEQLGGEHTGTAATIAAGIATFLIERMRLPGGAFASAQDSESTVAGSRVEGGYYLLDAAAREVEVAPALDDKVLTGWNGLAIGALASAGFAFDRPDWTVAAATAADYLIEHHLLPDGILVRTSVGPRVSAASATLEDYGMFADGLLQLAAVSGDVRYAVIARQLVDACLAAAVPLGVGPFAVPGGADPVLAGQGLALSADPSEGAYPSGSSAAASAARRLYLLGADGPSADQHSADKSGGAAGYLEASRAAMGAIASLVVTRPVSFGAALEVMSGLLAPAGQLVIVGDDSQSSIVTVARRWVRSGAMVAVVTDAAAVSFADAGFELFRARNSLNGITTAYLCHDFVCRLPLTDPTELDSALAS